MRGTDGDRRGRDTTQRTAHTVAQKGAFTDPSHRGCGYVVECLKAIEGDAERRGRRRACALVELHNRSSIRAFRRAGFERAGLVVTARRPCLAGHVGRPAALRVLATP